MRVAARGEIPHVHMVAKWSSGCGISPGIQRESSGWRRTYLGYGPEPRKRTLRGKGSRPGSDGKRTSVAMLPRSARNGLPTPSQPEKVRFALMKRLPKAPLAKERVTLAIRTRHTRAYTRDTKLIVSQSWSRVKLPKHDVAKRRKCNRSGGLCGI